MFEHHPNNLPNNPFSGSPIATNSHSNIRVELAGIPGSSLSPYASSAGMISSRCPPTYHTTPLKNCGTQPMRHLHPADAFVPACNDHPTTKRERQGLQKCVAFARVELQPCSVHMSARAASRWAGCSARAFTVQTSENESIKGTTLEGYRGL